MFLETVGGACLIMGLFTRFFAAARRSLIDLLGTIQTLRLAGSISTSTGVDLYLDQQSIDTTTPAGKLVFQVGSTIRQKAHPGSIAGGQRHAEGRPRVRRRQWDRSVHPAGDDRPFRRRGGVRPKPHK
jgi:hypothetical protein